MQSIGTRPSSALFRLMSTQARLGGLPQDQPKPATQSVGDTFAFQNVHQGVTFAGQDSKHDLRQIQKKLGDRKHLSTSEAKWVAEKMHSEDASEQNLAIQVAGQAIEQNEKFPLTDEHLNQVIYPKIRKNQSERRQAIGIETSINIRIKALGNLMGRNKLTALPDDIKQILFVRAEQEQFEATTKATALQAIEKGMRGHYIQSLPKSTQEAIVDAASSSNPSVCYVALDALSTGAEKGLIRDVPIVEQKELASRLIELASGRVILESKTHGKNAETLPIRAGRVLGEITKAGMLTTEREIINEDRTNSSDKVMSGRMDQGAVGVLFRELFKEHNDETTKGYLAKALVSVIEQKKITEPLDAHAELRLLKAWGNQADSSVGRVFHTAARHDLLGCAMPKMIREAVQTPTATSPMIHAGMESIANFCRDSGQDASRPEADRVDAETVSWLKSYENSRDRQLKDAARATLKAMRENDMQPITK